jgi:hypothetical protein
MRSVSRGWSVSVQQQGSFRKNVGGGVEDEISVHEKKRQRDARATLTTFPHGTQRAGSDGSSLMRDIASSSRSMMSASCAGVLVSTKMITIADRINPPPARTASTMCDE